MRKNPAVGAAAFFLRHSAAWSLLSAPGPLGIIAPAPTKLGAGRTGKAGETG